MAVRNIVRKASQAGFATPTSAPIRIDTSTNTPFYNGAGSGTTEKEIVDVSSSQTLTNKTITAPSLSGAIENDTKVLAATATFTTNTVLASLSGLTATLVAGKTYQFEVELFTTQTVNGGLQAAFTLTGAVLASAQISARQYAAASSAQTNVTSTVSANAIVNNKTAAYICTELIGTIVVTTGGTLDIQVAQNTSNSDTTSVLLGSYARFTRVN